MKALAVFRKTLREVCRDRLLLVLTLAFAPLFVVVYSVAFPEAITAQTLVVVDQDEGAVLADGTAFQASTEVVDAVQATTTAQGSPLVRVVTVGSVADGERALRDREASALLVLPEDLSRSLAAWVEDPATAEPVTLRVSGDLTSSSYLVTAVVAQSAIDAWVEGLTGQTPPLTYVEDPLGGSAVRSDFDVYVAGLLVFAMAMQVFLSAMTIARDVETGVTRRLRLTRMTAVDYLLGTSGVLLLVAVVSVLVTFGTASALGFHSQSSLWLAVGVTILTSLAVIGIGMATGACAGTVSRAFVLANFPFGLLAFLSGSVYPLPDSGLVTVLGHRVGPLDLLPTTHAVTALNKILTAGTGLRDVAFELVALAILTALSFALGTALLRWSWLRPTRAVRRPVDDPGPDGVIVEGS